MEPELSRIDRRKFTQGLAAASGFLAIGSATSLISAAGERSADDTKTGNDPEQPGAPDPANAKPAPPAEELLLLNCIMQRYPSEHFDDAAIRGIYSDLRGDIARGRILSEFPLQNSDAPSSIFRAYRRAP